MSSVVALFHASCTAPGAFHPSFIADCPYFVWPCLPKTLNSCYPHSGDTRAATQRVSANCDRVLLAGRRQTHAIRDTVAHPPTAGEPYKSCLPIDSSRVHSTIAVITLVAVFILCGSGSEVALEARFCFTLRHAAGRTLLSALRITKGTA